MNRKRSAGILVYRFVNMEVEFLLAHPGGPFFAKKDRGAWSIPKGEYDENEEPFAAAKREFFEETGLTISGTFKALKPVKLSSGKEISAWAIENSLSITSFKSNDFTIEWPPKSGKMAAFPEIDKLQWFPKQLALEKINQRQAAFILELTADLKGQ